MINAISYVIWSVWLIALGVVLLFTKAEVRQAEGSLLQASM